MEVYDEKCKKFREEEKELMVKMKAEGGFTGLDEDWIGYQSEEVIPHFPPQLIIGKQVGEDKEFMVYDEDPLVRITV